METVLSHQIELSILTPVHNDSETLKASLTATLSLDTDLPFELIIIDDGSTDESASIAKDFVAKDKRVTLIQKKAGGEASALNAGLEKATGRYIAILEADVEAESNWLAMLVACLEEKDVLGAGGYIMTPRGDPWIARLAGYEVEYRMSKRDRFVVHITSANALYKAEAFQQYGRFDEKLVNSCLDVDFNQRIIADGKKLAFLPEAKVMHHFKGSFFEYLKRQFAYGFYRPFLKSLHLYKRDINITLQMIFTLCIFACAPLLVWSLWPIILSLIALFLTQLPLLGEMYTKKKDPVIFLFPAVLFFRNTVGLAGLISGMIKKHFS